jgi:hypothetical protein
MHRERPVERAAPAVLDGVAQRLDAGRLADRQWSILMPCFPSHSMTFTVPWTDGPSSSEVMSRPIALVVRMFAHEVLDRGDERRQRGLHVGGAAAVQVAVAHLGRERVAGPGLRGPEGTTSVCPANTTSGLALPRTRPEVVDAPKGRRSTLKPSGSRRRIIISWQPSSRGVCDGRRDELLREFEVLSVIYIVKSNRQNADTPRKQ